MKLRTRFPFAVLPLCCVLAACALFACPAGAEVVHAGGHVYGVTLHRGVAAQSLPGSVARTATAAPSVTPGTLSYHNGPVVHSSTPYLIFWTPGADTVPLGTRSLLERYFTDVAGDSGASSNVYGVARQYTDATGFANYAQTFSTSTQALMDTGGYPARDTANCPYVASTYPTCVTDAQLQAELNRQIVAGTISDHGATGNPLPAGVPIYFVVMPTDVNVCLPSGAGCASSTFCAYHSSFLDSAGHEVLYAAIPTWILGTGQNPKLCQDDGNTAIQVPNGTNADVVTKYLSHEDNEVITDPTGYGWWDNASGNENGDDCNQTGPANPTNATNPNAFLPTLGGSASPTLVDQTISGHNYYLQSEWSNGDGGCQMQPSGGTVTPSFTAPTGASAVGAPLGFNPAASTSTNTLAGASWDFGDTGGKFDGHGQSLNSVTHAYAAAGNYTVTLTMVDNRGNLATTSHQVTVYSRPVPQLAVTTAVPTEGTPTAFDATASTDPDPGVTISSYVWNFGDGHTTTGATPSHTYTAAGTYTVTLTVTNSVGLAAVVSQPVTVADERPTAAFSLTTQTPGSGQATSFDASASSEPDGSISSYAWDFGDGHTASGAQPSHPYQTPGTYTVTLTVTDSDGQTATVTHSVTVVGPLPSFAYTAGIEAQSTSFDATTTRDSDANATIQSYTWNFGNGVVDTLPTATDAYTYTHAGTYLVTLTVTDSLGFTTSTSQSITIADELPTAAFSVTTATPGSGLATSFDATASSDANATGPDGTVTAYSWDFGDGQTGTGATPSHTYAAPGLYTATLTVTDSDGQRSTPVSQQVVVAGPTATFTAPGQAMEDTGVSFDAGGSSAGPGRSIAGYAWSFDDGTSAVGPAVAHVFTTPGAHSATLTVTDDLGRTDSISHGVTIADTPPSAAFAITTALPATGQPVGFDGRGSSDPDEAVTGWSWQFGDGATGSGPTPSHVYAAAGTYTVTLVATDANGQPSAALSHQVTVRQPPTAAFTLSPGPPREGVSIRFDGSASADPEPGASVTSWRWSFGDGQSATGVSPAHTFARFGTYTVLLTVGDSAGLSATTSLRVVVADEPPVPGFALPGGHLLTGQSLRFDGSPSREPDGTISAYSWSFGDGATAHGRIVSHQYRTAGHFTVTLIVTDSGGQHATTSHALDVALTGRIGRVRVAQHGTNLSLAVSVNTAGSVRVGHRKVAVHGPGTIRIAINLTRRQLHTLSVHGSLKLRTQVIFSPTQSPMTKQPVTLVLHLDHRPNRRYSAVLLNR